MLISSAVVWEGKDRMKRYRALNTKLSQHLEHSYNLYLLSAQTNLDARKSRVIQTEGNFDVILYHILSEFNEFNRSYIPDKLPQQRAYTPGEHNMCPARKTRMRPTASTQKVSILAQSWLPYVFYEPKYVQNAFPAGSLPRIPLGELTTLTQTS